MITDWLFRSCYTKLSCSRQAKYFRVTLFSRPAVAVTLCWLIPLIFLTGLPVSQYSEEQPSHDKQPATKLALCPHPTLLFISLLFPPPPFLLFPSLTFSPSLQRPRGCQRITVAFVSILLSFVSSLPAVFSLCPPLWAIYVKAGGSSAPLGWWIESWLWDRQQKMTIHKPWAEYSHIQGCNYDASNSSKTSLSTFHLYV